MARRVYAKRYAQAIFKIAVEKNELDRWQSDLSKITCPTLIIAGEYDSFLGPANGEIAHKSIPGSQLQVFPAGHAPALEHPLEYNETILKFLAKVSE